MCEPYVLLLRGANRGKESRDGDVIYNHQDLPLQRCFPAGQPPFLQPAEIPLPGSTTITQHFILGFIPNCKAT